MSARALVQDSQYEYVQRAYAASMDLVLDLKGLDFSQQRKENFLFFAATVNSTMDYSIKVIEDSVVDNPPNHGHVPQVVNSLSPLRMKRKL